MLNVTLIYYLIVLSRIWYINAIYSINFLDHITIIIDIVMSHAIIYQK